jgi:hypothetical protein
MDLTDNSFTRCRALQPPQRVFGGGYAGFCHRPCFMVNLGAFASEGKKI